LPLFGSPNLGKKTFFSDEKSENEIFLSPGEAASGEPGRMDLRPLLSQIALLAGSAGLLLAGLLLVLGHTRDAYGLIFGVTIGVANQGMIALRVSRIGMLGGRRRTIWFIQTGTAMRFLMIAMAVIIVLREPQALGFLGLVAGLLLTMVVGAVVGIRMVLR